MAGVRLIRNQETNIWKEIDVNRKMSIDYRSLQSILHSISDYRLNARRMDWGIDYRLL